MRNVYISALLLAVLLVASSGAQEKIDSLSISKRMETVAVQFSSTDELVAEGWEPVEPGVWRKTFDNGMESEIALGSAAFERATRRLDARIEALQALESRDVKQDLRLFELLLHREQLDQVRPLTKASWSEALCTGTASFVHTYGYPYNVAYPLAESETSFARWSSTGTATTYAEASLCGNGTCVFDSERDDTGYGLTVDAQAGGIPTWTCTADAYGLVYLGGSGLPSHCLRIAYYSTDWNC